MKKFKFEFSPNSAVYFRLTDRQKKIVKLTMQLNLKPKHTKNINKYHVAQFLYKGYDLGLPMEYFELAFQQVFIVPIKNAIINKHELKFIFEILWVNYIQGRRREFWMRTLLEKHRRERQRALKKEYNILVNDSFINEVWEGWGDSIFPENYIRNGQWVSRR